MKELILYNSNDSVVNNQKISVCEEKILLKRITEDIDNFKLTERKICEKFFLKRYIYSVITKDTGEYINAYIRKIFITTGRRAIIKNFKMDYKLVNSKLSEVFSNLNNIYVTSTGVLIGFCSRYIFICISPTVYAIINRKVIIDEEDFCIKRISDSYIDIEVDSYTSDDEYKSFDKSIPIKFQFNFFDSGENIIAIHKRDEKEDYQNEIFYGSHIKECYISKKIPIDDVPNEVYSNFDINYVYKSHYDIYSITYGFGQLETIRDVP